jgi:hypothetical protein
MLARRRTVSLRQFPDREGPILRRVLVAVRTAMTISLMTPASRPLLKGRALLGRGSGRVSPKRTSSIALAGHLPVFARQAAQPEHRLLPCRLRRNAEFINGLFVSEPRPSIAGHVRTLSALLLAPFPLVSVRRVFHAGVTSFLQPSPIFPFGQGSRRGFPPKLGDPLHVTRSTIQLRPRFMNPALCEHDSINRTMRWRYSYPKPPQEFKIEVESFLRGTES